MLKGKRAVSTMIGVTFFVLITLTGLNLLFYGLAQQNLLATSLTAKERTALDKRSELLQILDVKIDATSRLNITAFSAGGRTVHIVRIWITNQSAPAPWHHSFDVNYWIGMGTILANIGSGLGTFSQTSKFSFNLVSDRGNVFVANYAPPQGVLMTAQGFGWLTLDWNLYNYTVSVSPSPDSAPQGAWCIILPSGGGQARYQFIVGVVNHWDRDVYLLSVTYLALIPSNGSPQIFFIMNQTSTAQTPAAYVGQINVPANINDQQTGGSETILKFYASSPGGTSQSNNALNGGSFVVFVVLYYQDSQTGSTYAQTVPFESTEILSSGSCS